MFIHAVVLRRMLMLTALAGTAGAALADAKQADYNGDGRADLAIGVPNETVNGEANSGGVHVIYGRASGLDAAGDQFWTAASPGVNAPDEGGRFGYAVESGDFDGDGLSDLAIGIIDADADGVSGGGVQVLYGSSTGLSVARDQFWSRASDGVQGDPEASAAFGFTLAGGDFDGDGRDDLAITAANQEVGGQNIAGEVHILYGSASGLSAAGDQIFNQDTPGIDGVPEFGDAFGERLAAGDFDNDGRDDLAIGVNREDGGTGVVYVLYGTAAGLTTSRVQFLQQGLNGLEGTAEPSDSFGFGLASGDFNDDGIADLAIGAFFDTVDGIVFAGTVAVLYGTPQGLDTIDDQLWSQESPRVIDTAATSEFFGFALAAGDFNGDGRDDLAIGAFGEIVGGHTEAGAVNVLYGTNNGLRAGGNQFWHQDSQGIGDVAQPEDRFGQSLTAGDYNGDGFDDLAVGIYQEDVNGNQNCGAVNVIYGAARGLSRDGDQFWHQDSPGILDAPAPGEEFGWSVR